MARTGIRYLWFLTFVVPLLAAHNDTSLSVNGLVIEKIRADSMLRLAGIQPDDIFYR